MLNFNLLQFILIFITIILHEIILTNSLEKTAKKNVLFIMVDDLRPTISGYKDSLAKTPHIDALMKKSFHFTRAYCQQSLCGPSRNSMLTGRRPETIRLFDFYSYWRTFAGNFTTLPQYFKENGYKTQSIGKIFHPGISSNYNDDYPLSWTEKPFHPKTDIYANAPVCPNGSGALKMNLICPIRVADHPGKTLPDIETMQKAKRFLIHNNFYKNQTIPFFLGIGFHKPHVPFKFPKKFLNNFPREIFENVTLDNFKPYNMPNVAWNPYTDIRKRDDFKNQQIPFPFGPIPKNLRISIWQSYYASVAYIDNLIGEILKKVNLNNTIVIMTSDHGWSLGENGVWAKYSNFEKALRVPLIIYSPDFQITESKEIHNIVELVDIFPSLVDLVALPPIEKCSNKLLERMLQKTCTEGHSFYDILTEGYRNFTSVALSQYPRPSEYPSKRPNSDKPKLKDIHIMGYSMRTTNFRYTMWVEYNSKNFTKNWKKIYGVELYDHRIDNDEKMNLFGRVEYKNIEKRLEKRLIRRFS